MNTTALLDSPPSSIATPTPTTTKGVAAPVVANVTTAAKPPAIQVQTVAKFLAQVIPPKEPLVDKLLYRRDLVCLAGRRRHGKTSFISCLAMSLALPVKQFLGYEIADPKRVVVFFLEDDPGELQDKLKKLLKGQEPPERLAVYTRIDFLRDGIPIDVYDSKFVAKVRGICQGHHPDLIVLDNLAHLIGADYNQSTKIQKTMNFAFGLACDFNTAVVIAAHPRKRGAEPPGVLPSNGCLLRSDPEAFFENVMGSSHFVNSCGSLWGMERNVNTNRTDFLGGAQRFTGEQSFMVLEFDEDGWAHVLDDFNHNLPFALNTLHRRNAWEMLPERFTFLEGERLVASVLKKSAYNEWVGLLKRMRLIVSDGSGYMKANAPGAPAKTPG